RFRDPATIAWTTRRRPEPATGGTMAIAIHAQRSLAEACGAEIAPAASAAPASDEALLLRFQTHGDEQAFRMLFSRHKDAFVSFLWRLSGRRSVADDVSQHCCLKLIELGRDGR